MKRAMKKITRAVTSFVVLLVGLIALAGHDAYGFSKGDVSQEIVNIEIEGNHFAIPKGYIWFEGAWKGGKRDGVNMWTILPDMQPRTEANKNEFDGPGGFRDVIGILLHRYNNPVTSQEGPNWQRKRKQQSFEWKVKEFTQGEPVDGPYGFKLYRPRKPSRDGELLFRQLPDGSLYFIQCHTDSQGPFPGCSSEIYLSDKLYIRYTYGKQHLKDWQAVDKKIRELIRGFEINKSSGKQGG